MSGNNDNMPSAARQAGITCRDYRKPPHGMCCEHYVGGLGCGLYTKPVLGDGDSVYYDPRNCEWTRENRHFLLCDEFGEEEVFAAKRVSRTAAVLRSSPLDLFGNPNPHYRVRETASTVRVESSSPAKDG